jgi:hypothetical protein
MSSDSEKRITVTFSREREQITFRRHRHDSDITIPRYPLTMKIGERDNSYMNTKIYKTKLREPDMTYVLQQMALPPRSGVR